MEEDKVCRRYQKKIGEPGSKNGDNFKKMIEEEEFEEGPKDEGGRLINTTNNSEHTTGLNPKSDKPPLPPSKLPTGQAGEQVPLEVKADAPQPQSLTQHPTLHTQHNNEMEVHHHGHVHEKKKWKEYLFQFLMLFLAVFCGFLAEYQLEQTIERHREKDYIKSFTEDLQSDLSEISWAMPFLKERELSLDSLNYGLHNSHFNRADLYFYARQSTRPIGVTPSDRTIIQLKNSGGFRLITNKQTADSILAYQGLIENYQFALKREAEEIQHLLPFLSKLFDAKVFDEMVDNANRIHKPTGNPQMRSSDPNLINEFSYYVHLLKTTTLLKNKSLHRMHMRATNILQFLKTQYHLNE